MIEAKLTKEFDNMIKRLRASGAIVTEAAMAYSQRDADGLIAEFRNGILNNKFPLVPLKKETIDRKTAKGYRHPAYPLFGMGDGLNKTYCNAMLIRKLKDGYKIEVRRARHHEAKLDLDNLFTIHEKGARIPKRMGAKPTGKKRTSKRKERGDKDVSIGGYIIIPARPAMEIAIKWYSQKRRAENREKMMANAIKRFFLTGIWKNPVPRWKEIEKTY